MGTPVSSYSEVHPTVPTRNQPPPLSSTLSERENDRTDLQRNRPQTGHGGRTGCRTLVRWLVNSFRVGKPSDEFSLLRERRGRWPGRRTLDTLRTGNSTRHRPEGGETDPLCFEMIQMKSTLKIYPFDQSKVTSICLFLRLGHHVNLLPDRTSSSSLPYLARTVNWLVEYFIPGSNFYDWV